MHIEHEGERITVEYEDHRGRKFYTDAEGKIEDDKDFSVMIKDEDLPAEIKKAKNEGELITETDHDLEDDKVDEVIGRDGFEKLTHDQQCVYLKERIDGGVKDA